MAAQKTQTMNGRLITLAAVARYGSVFCVFLSYFDQPNLSWPRITSALLLFWALLAAFQDRRPADDSVLLWVALEIGQGLVVFFIGLSVDNSGWYWILYLILIMSTSLTIPFRYGGGILLMLFMMRVVNFMWTSTLSTAAFMQSFVTTLWLWILLSLTGYIVVNKLDEMNALEKMAQKLTSSNQQLTAAYDKLQEYSRELEETAALRERARIAREIHDSLGHNMIGLVLQLEAASRSLAQDPPLSADHLHNALQLAKLATTEMRHAVKALRPPLLIPGQIILALERLIDDFSAVTGVDVEFLTNLQEFVLADQVEITVYRSVQEALTNAYRHGGANNILVHIRQCSHWMAVRVHDDGLGVTQVQENFGLDTMRRRTEQAGGTIRFRSRIHHGFTIFLIVPIGNARFAGS